MAVVVEVSVKDPEMTFVGGSAANVRVRGDASQSTGQVEVDRGCLRGERMQETGQAEGPLFVLRIHELSLRTVEIRRDSGYVK